MRTKVLRSDDARLSLMQSSVNELRDRSLSCHGDQQDGSRPAREKTPGRRSGVRATVITSQPASAPGEYGVQFLARDKRFSSAGRGSLLEETCPPPMATGSPGRDMRLHPRTEDLFPFGIACNPERCSFLDDHISPGYY